MLPTLFIVVLLHLFRLSEGEPTFLEEYRGSYVPKTIETWYGRQVIAPDTPYVATAGPNQLYFIDTRFDNETASHVKEQIEKASIPKVDGYFYIDEISATVEIKNSETNETTFVFDPPYARVIFAQKINKRNPELKLPEHEPAGDWLVTYDVGTRLSDDVGTFTYCSELGCGTDQACVDQSGGICNFCDIGRVDNECAVVGNPNKVGMCGENGCVKPVDTPKEDGETDSDYYQRMDKLHWT
ncbi:uncharacterized protein BHQ10_010375 [Talaromyces amestolkiae]|uniref:Uncharacterized protein n=1 Tax=Talaromyces amestolkiae TaxID=1196081 RepID=A0A364LEY9_TALAM|nr:uncharacterized protein BHQ10_010375 [Talaromyces amestolkiae]RAO74363.1 hypothetical protein BHQ10_010375 [Talaromyces amestolkiae]